MGAFCLPQFASVLLATCSLLCTLAVYRAWHTFCVRSIVGRQGTWIVFSTNTLFYLQCGTIRGAPPLPFTFAMGPPSDNVVAHLSAVFFYDITVSFRELRVPH